MNILGLVFSLLLILSYGFYASWDKQSASHRLRTTYLSHQKAHRKLLNHYQSELYGHLSSQKNPSAPQEEATEDEPSNRPKKPELNRECAKLNIWPLIQEGREKHPLLYELVAKLIRTFYSHPLSEGQKRFEYHFLDELLASAKGAAQQEPFALEKIEMKESQRLYYKMLKGTREWDLPSHLGYPCLLDYLKAEPSQEKICLFHAHPDLFFVLFGPKVAATLYPEIHRKEAPPLTRELIEHFCSQAHLFTVDPDLLDLLELGHPIHHQYKKTLIAEEDQVSLRKSVILKEEKS